MEYSRHFLRSILLARPIAIYYRNKTADEFAAVTIQLANEMNDIGRNFNQVVKKVNMAHSDDELGLYLFDLYLQQQKIDLKVSETCEKMHQIFWRLASERDHLKDHKIELEKLALEPTAAADQQVNKSGQ